VSLSWYLGFSRGEECPGDLLG